MTNETKELNTYTMQELYKQPLEPVEYLVDGLLAPGLYILGGSPKVGKSWMALQLCLAVCGGKAFLGRATRESEVLYLALEDGPQRLHSRALRLADTALEGLHLCHRAAPIGQGLERQIEAQLAEYPHIRLVVLDTLQKVRCVSGSGMSYSSDYEDAGALKALADRNGICLLVIHHLRKMADDDPFNRLSGTNGLAGAADGTLILMRNKRQDGTATLYATGRDIEDVEEELEFTDCRWSRAVPQEQLQLTLVVNALKKLLAAGEFQGTATELASRLETQGSYIGARQSSPNFYKATMRRWLSVGYCWRPSEPIASGCCACAMRCSRLVTPVTRVTAVTGVTDTAIPGVSRHNRHQRHVRHWHHEFETIRRCLHGIYSTMRRKKI